MAGLSSRTILAASAVCTIFATMALAAPPVIPVTPQPRPVPAPPFTSPKPVSPFDPSPGIAPGFPACGGIGVPPTRPIVVPVPVPVPVGQVGGFGVADEVVSVVSLRNETAKTVTYEFMFNGKYKQFELEPGAERFHASEGIKPDQTRTGRVKYKDGDRERKFTVTGLNAPMADFQSGRLFRFVAGKDGVDLRGAK